MPSPLPAVPLSHPLPSPPCLVCPDLSHSLTWRSLVHPLPPTLARALAPSRTNPLADSRALPLATSLHALASTLVRSCIRPCAGSNHLVHSRARWRLAPAVTHPPSLAPGLTCLAPGLLHPSTRAWTWDPRAHLHVLTVPRNKHLVCACFSTCRLPLTTTAAWTCR